MRYRGVKIKTIYYGEVFDVKPQRNLPDWKIVPVSRKTGYAPIGMGYPMTLDECRQTIDNLIAKLTRQLGVTEKIAIELLNAPT